MDGEQLHLSAQQTLEVQRESDEELVLLASWKPGSVQPPLHLHPAQEEVFEIREGTLNALVAGKAQRLETGGTLEIPGGTPHTIWNASDEDAASATWITRPARRTADFFRAMDRLTQGGTAAPPGEELLATLREYADVFELAPPRGSD